MNKPINEMTNKQFRLLMLYCCLSGTAGIWGGLIVGKWLYQYIHGYSAWVNAHGGLWVVVSGWLAWF